MEWLRGRENLKQTKWKLNETVKQTNEKPAKSKRKAEKTFESSKTVILRITYHAKVGVAHTGCQPTSLSHEEVKKKKLSPP